MQNVRLDESKAEIKSQENTNNLRYADDTTLIAASKEELRSLLMNAKEKSEKADLKLNIQKTRYIQKWILNQKSKPLIVVFNKLPNH